MPLKWGFELLTDGKATKDQAEDRQVVGCFDKGCYPVTGSNQQLMQH